MEHRKKIVITVRNSLATYFQNSLTEVCREVGIDLEQQIMPEQFIYADDYDNLIEDQDKSISKTRHQTPTKT